VTTTIRVAALAGAVALLAAPALADDSTELSDHLPDALEGDRIVHVRTQGGDGAIACDRLRLEPKGSPSDRVGTAVIEESGARYEIDYAGSPLVLSSPRMVVAGKRCAGLLIRIALPSIPIVTCPSIAASPATTRTAGVGLSRAW